MRKIKKQKGFIAFSSLLIVSAVILTMVMSVSLLGIGQLNSSLGFMKGSEALQIGQGCVEEALLRLRDNTLYSGGTLTIGSGTCTSVITGSGSTKTILVTTTLPGPPIFVKKLQITAKRVNNSINIITWTEIE